MQVPEVFQFQQSCAVERFEAIENQYIGATDQVSLPQPLFLLSYQDFAIRVVQIVEPRLIALIDR
jgi:hypothetical protein